MTEYRRQAKDLLPSIKQWRRDLHRIPELEKDLSQTSGYLRERLDEMHIPYVIQAETGLCGLIEGSSPGKTIALRADMDALPTQEETGLPYASANGRMHACGHDAHMAVLLGAASLLRGVDFPGNVKLLFQPDEEKNGGAKQMIADGCLDKPNVDAILGMHVGSLFPELDGGQIGVRSGPIMAAVDRFHVTVSGTGGHGARPEDTTDPLLCAVNMVGALHQIISRELSATSPAVLTVGSFRAGDAFNIIPSAARFAGTVRTTTAQDRTYVERRVREVCAGTAAAGRCRAEVDYVHAYPALVNDPGVTSRFSQSAARIVGAENVIPLEKPTMGSEDMSYFMEQVPGTYFFLGTQNVEKGIVYPNHHAKFDVDEDLLWIGTAAFVQAAMDFLHS